MGCCGDKRARLAARGRPDEAMARAAWSPPGGRGLRTATVRYRMSSTLRLSGPSGRSYEFSGGRDVQAVDRSDVPFLLRTGHFEVVSGDGLGP